MENESCEFYDVGCWLGWLAVEIKEIALAVWLEIMNGFAAVVEWIPVPEFLNQIANSSISLPAGVLYFVDAFALKEGLAIIATAYVARFILRRIPFIG